MWYPTLYTHTRGCSSMDDTDLSLASVVFSEAVVCSTPLHPEQTE